MAQSSRIVRAYTELVCAKGLQPGDLFSVRGDEHWSSAFDRGSIGERVYVRTNIPCPPDQEGEQVFRITLEVDG